MVATSPPHSSLARGLSSSGSRITHPESTHLKSLGQKPLILRIKVFGAASKVNESSLGKENGLQRTRKKSQEEAHQQTRVMILPLDLAPECTVINDLCRLVRVKFI